MAITQLNTSNYDYAMMLNVINKSYKGMNQITLSAYDTTAAPDVKVGSVFEDNGALFIVDTSDLAPTGYAGITNSTTFYLYYDVDPGTAFIYSNTAPTWSDALQGWYNGNDRAFFSMYKDSGGTLYLHKNKLGQREFETYLNRTLAISTTWIIPPGTWMLAFNDTTGDISAQTFLGGSWLTMFNSSHQQYGMVKSDGVNMRVNNGSGSLTHSVRIMSIS